MRVTRPRLRRGRSRSATGGRPEGRGLSPWEVDHPVTRPEPGPALVEQSDEDRGAERTAQVWPQLCPIRTGDGEGPPRAARRMKIHTCVAQRCRAALGQPEVAPFSRLQPAL